MVSSMEVVGSEYPKVGRSCQGGCGKVRNVVISGLELDDWWCFDCRKNGSKQPTTNFNAIVARVVDRPGSLLGRYVEVEAAGEVQIRHAYHVEEGSYFEQLREAAFKVLRSWGLQKSGHVDVWNGEAFIIYADEEAANRDGFFKCSDGVFRTVGGKEVRRG